MEIPELIELGKARVRDTGQGVRASVRGLWVAYGRELSEENIHILAQEGLATRLNAELTHPSKESEGAAEEGMLRVAYTGESNGETRAQAISVAAVRILHETMFDTPSGVRKAFAEFGVADCNYYVSAQRAQIAGGLRRIEVMEYAKGRLMQLGKKKIADLAQGEQTILARKWAAAANGKATAAA